MMYDKKSMDYQINLETLKEMEECVPMTKNKSMCRHPFSDLS